MPDHTRLRRATIDAPTLRAAALAGIVGLSACGGPAAPSPSLEAIAFLPHDTHMFVGASQTLAANAVLSNGSVSPITGGAWSSDTPSVATVSATGRVQAVSPGDAAIFLDYQGQQRRTPLRVVPDYRGDWTGTYLVTSCPGTGSVQDITCRTLHPMGVPQPIALNLVQDKVLVSGTLSMGAAQGTFEGFLHRDGTLVLAHGGAWEPGVVHTLMGWEALAVGPRMDGTFSFSVTMGTTPGGVLAFCSLQSMTRVSGGVRAGQ